MREPVTPYTPPPPSPVAPAVDALTTILAALKRPDTGSAAANAHHAAIRRKGREMVEEFGVEAVNDAVLLPALIIIRNHGRVAIWPAA